MEVMVQEGDSWILKPKGFGTMANRQKYAVLDRTFLSKMVALARDQRERGMIKLLYATGIHGGSLRSLTRANVKREGNRYYLRWRRLKTQRQMEAQLPADQLGDIFAFLDGPKRSLRWYDLRLRKIGELAGFDDVSAMTFRHTKCIELWKEGKSLPEVCQLLGVSQEVAVRNYSKLSADQLRESDSGNG